MTHSTTIVLAPETFPYMPSHEGTFLRHELRALARRFARVVVVPQMISGDERAPLPSDVELDESFAQTAPGRRRRDRAGAILRGAASGTYLLELPNHLQLDPYARLLRYAARAAERAERANRWILSAIDAKAIVPERTIVYTYWTDPFALGATKAKERYPQLAVVSRAHGYDLFEERHSPPIIPFRSRLLRGLDRVFSVSDAGARYLADRYPFAGSKIVTARLGVQDPGFLTPPSSDRTVRVVSCSAMVELKRVGLIFAGVRAFALRDPERRVEWTHFGGGPLFDEVERAAETAPSNLRVSLPGRVSNDDVFARYRSAPVDAFINASTTEGVPVAAMEALSCGIPVIATAVGGTPELVRDDRGVLLPRDPTADQVADALENLVAEGRRTPVRLRSRETWAAMANADQNYELFADALQEVRERLTSSGRMRIVPSFR